MTAIRTSIPYEDCSVKVLELESRMYTVEHLREFSERVFQHCGLSAEDAAQAADVLVTADVWGITSHGVARLRAYYEMLAHGHVNPRPRIQVVRQMPATATLDGDNGLGLVVGPKANQLALEKADAVGSSWVSVRHSHHFGIAGYYPTKALARDMIGWAMTNTTPQVAPLWGVGPMLGTNPIAIAFPGKKEPPIIIDMATSAISYGVVENAQRQGVPLPDRCMIDGQGRPTTSPEQMRSGAALLPLGGDREHGGHKGYCLSAMIDILSGVLSGANWGPFVPPFPYYLRSPKRRVGQGIGHLFGAMRIDAFIEPDEFKLQIDDWIREFRAATPVDGTGGPLIPGDPEREAAARNLLHGISLLDPVTEDLRYVAAQTGVPFD